MLMTMERSHHSLILKVNFYRCLRLTERCADILISIRDEVHEAGDTVSQELAAPIGKLEEYAFYHRPYASDADGFQHFPRRTSVYAETGPTSLLGEVPETGQDST